MRLSRRSRVCPWGAYAIFLTACSGSAPNSPLHDGAAQGEQPRDTAPAEQRPPDLVLAHRPAFGARSFVEVHTEGSTRVLRVSRAIPKGVAAAWTVRFSGADAQTVDGIVNDLASSADVEKSCPRRHDRDGVVWAVYLPARQLNYGVDFRMTSAGPDCARFEATAVRLMRLAQLTCGWSACLRPEEITNRRLSCAAGEAGRECRDAPDGTFSLSEAALRMLDE